MVFSTTSWSTTLISLLKSVGTVSNSSVYNSSAIGFKLAKTVFLANSDVSIPVTFLNQILLHN